MLGEIYVMIVDEGKFLYSLLMLVILLVSLLVKYSFDIVVIYVFLLFWKCIFVVKGSG